jgi:hypothetical protein
MLFWLLPVLSAGNTTGNTYRCCVGVLYISCHYYCPYSQLAILQATPTAAVLVSCIYRVIIIAPTLSWQYYRQHLLLLCWCPVHIVSLLLPLLSAGNTTGNTY